MSVLSRDVMGHFFVCQIDGKSLILQPNKAILIPTFRSLVTFKDYNYRQNILEENEKDNC